MNDFGQMMLAHSQAVIVRGHAVRLDSVQPFLDRKEDPTTLAEYAAVDIVGPNADRRPALVGALERPVQRLNLATRKDVLATVREHDVPANINLNAIHVWMGVLRNDCACGNGEHLHLELISAVKQDRGHVLDLRHCTGEGYCPDHGHIFQEP